MAASITIWAAARASGVALVVGEHRIGWAAVVLTAGLAAAAGTAVLRLLQRRYRNGRSAWTVVATIAFFQSLVGPFGAGTAAAIGTLVGMHTAVYLVLVGVAWFGPGRRARS